MLHLFVFDPIWYEKRAPLTGLPRTGPLRTCFQLECLADLRARLEAAGHSLSVRVGRSTGSVFAELCRDFDVAGVFCSQEVCEEERQVLDSVRVELDRHDAGELLPQWGFELFHRDDLPFDPVRRGAMSYTAFRKVVEERCTVRPPLPPLDLSASRAARWPGHDAQALPKLEDLVGAPLEDVPRTADPRAELQWVGGETAALKRVEDFLFETDALGLTYVGATLTTDPSKSVMRDGAMSKLSPWLAHGCLSPRQLYAEVKRYEAERPHRKGSSSYYIIHELCWRDFVRYQSLSLGTSIFKLAGPQNIRPAWEWSRDSKTFKAWREGLTGIPFIDVFMRELHATGYCNHMGRETVGWFLLRDLGIDWRMGAEWFESVLIDYEPAANWYNWVYRCLPAVTKSVGPRTQLQTLEALVWAAQHDPDATYTKRWLPELQALPAAAAREPWRVAMKTEDGGVRLPASAKGFRYGVDYPIPVVPPVLMRGIEETATKARQAQAKRDEKILRLRGAASGRSSNPKEPAGPPNMQRKEILRIAHDLFLRDRGMKAGSEWKRLRVAGGTDPVLASYLSKAGWDPSWPTPPPEGRAFRRDLVKAERKAEQPIAQALEEMSRKGSAAHLPDE